MVERKDYQMLTVVSDNKIIDDRLYFFNFQILSNQQVFLTFIFKVKFKNQRRALASVAQWIEH